MLKIYKNKNFNAIEIFNNYKNEILEATKTDTFISLYNLYYMDYWYYIHNETNIHERVIQNHHELHEHEKFIKFLLRKQTNEKIKHIMKLVCPYITYHEKINKSMVQNYIDLIKNNNVIYVQNEFETIMNLFFYRKLASREFDSFNDFYLKTFMNDSNKYDKFIKYIPVASNIALFDNKGSITNIHKINVVSIIKYIFKYLNVSYTLLKKNNDLLIQSNSNIIQIIFNDTNLITRTKINATNINETIPVNNIIIYLKTENIITLSQLLTCIHLLTVGIKTINAAPSNIYELENLLPYEDYFKDSFKIFFLIIKPNINKNENYNKFILEVLKYYYLYATVDFYFYVVPDIINLIVKDVNNKINILKLFFDDIQSEFQIPTNMYSYPPFIPNQQYDIDNVIYYCYEHPNYFKLYDYLNALFEVMNVKNTTSHFDKVFLKCINDVKICDKKTIKTIEKTIPKINETDDEYFEITASQI